MRTPEQHEEIEGVIRCSAWLGRHSRNCKIINSLDLRKPAADDIRIQAPNVTHKSRRTNAGLTTQAQRPGERDLSTTGMASPGSLERLVELSRSAAGEVGADNATEDASCLCAPNRNHRCTQMNTDKPGSESVSICVHLWFRSSARVHAPFPGAGFTGPGSGGCALGGLPTGYLHLSLRDIVPGWRR